MDVRGLNFRINGRSEIYMGVHVETFISLLQEAKKNEAGYINIKLTPHNKPTKHGFSHKAILQEEKSTQNGQP